MLLLRSHASFARGLLLDPNTGAYREALGPETTDGKIAGYFAFLGGKLIAIIRTAALAG
jgi:hypothetical protein